MTTVTADMRADLLSLAERLERAEGPSRELDARIHHALHPSQRVLLDPGSLKERRDPVYGTLAEVSLDGWAGAEWAGLADDIGAPRYTASIDVILRELVPPGCEVDMQSRKRYCMVAKWDADGRAGFPLGSCINAATLPLSACAASLRARAAMVEG